MHRTRRTTRTAGRNRSQRIQRRRRTVGWVPPTVSTDDNIIILRAFYSVLRCTGTSRTTRLRISVVSILCSEHEQTASSSIATQALGAATPPGDGGFVGPAVAEMDAPTTTSLRPPPGLFLFWIEYTGARNLMIFAVLVPVWFLIKTKNKNLVRFQFRLITVL